MATDLEILNSKVKSLEEENRLLREELTRVNENRDDFLIRTFNTMTDPVFVKDHKSRLLFVNDSFCRAFNMKRSEIIGKTLAEQVPEEERESFLAIDRQVIETGRESIHEETLTVDQAETRYISTKKSRFLDEASKPYLVGIIHDITVRVQAEQAVKQSNEKLSQLNRTKDRMISIISHDLRNPLTSIIGLIEILASDDPISKEQQKDYFGLLHQSTKGTLNMLENLISWARLQTGKLISAPERFEVNNLMQSVLEAQQGCARIKGIEIVVKPGNSKSDMISDPQMLSIILNNLMSNAIKYTKTSGEVILTFEDRKERYSFSVKDSGLGMPAELIKNLFADRPIISSLGTAKEKGTGLGLGLVKELVDMLGGTLLIESKPNKGSTFTVSLPKVESHNYPRQTPNLPS